MPDLNPGDFIPVDDVLVLCVFGANHAGVMAPQFGVTLFAAVKDDNQANFNPLAALDQYSIVRIRTLLSQSASLIASRRVTGDRLALVATSICSAISVELSAFKNSAK